MNKYPRLPEKIIDLHGYTKAEAKDLLDGLLATGEFKHTRLITGKGLFRGTGPVLRTYVENYLRNNGIKFSYAKLYDGGEGALEVYFDQDPQRKY